MSQILDKAVSIVKTHMNRLQLGALDNECMIETAMARLKNVEKRPCEIKADITAQIDVEIQHGISELRKFLTCPQVVERLLLYRESECPSASTVNDLEDLKIIYATRRIREEVNRWEKQTRVFENIQKTIFAAFEEKYITMENEIEVIENYLMSGDRHMFEIQKPSIGLGCGNAQSYSWAKGKRSITNSPVFMPLGFFIGMIASGPADPSPYYPGGRGPLDRYNENKTREMAVVTKNILCKLTQDTQQLKDIIKEKVDDILSSYYELTARIPDSIKIDQLILRNLTKEMENIEKNLSELTPLRQKATQLQGKLDLLYVQKIRTYDIDINNISGFDDTASPVAEGQYGMVFKASICQDNDCGCKQVALKQRKMPLCENTASDFLLEEYNLRLVLSCLAVFSSHP